MSDRCRCPLVIVTVSHAVEFTFKEGFIARLSTMTMSDAAEWILYYPYPDYDCAASVTTPNPYSGRISGLWTLAKTMVPSLADRIGNDWVKFYIIRSSFLYNTGGFSHIVPSCPTCLSIRLAPCSLAAEIGFGSTVMAANRPGTSNWSKMSSLVCRLVT